MNEPELELRHERSNPALKKRLMSLQRSIRLVSLIIEPRQDGSNAAWM